MSLRPYDVTVYDKTGFAERAILEADPEVRILSRFGAHDLIGRVHTFGAEASQRFDVSEPDADPAKKRVFLLSALVSVIHVKDLSATSFLVTALRLLLAESIQKLIVISEFPAEGILAISEPDELAAFNRSRDNGRLQFIRSAVDLPRVK